jgi:anti-anti-sigma factor
MPLTIEVTTRAHASGLPEAVVRLVGSLDDSTAASAQRTFAVLSTERPRLVIIDLEHLEFLDSRGISTLLLARIDLARVGSDVFLTRLKPPIRRVLDLVRVMPSSAIFGSMEELDAYLADVQRKARDDA